MKMKKWLAVLMTLAVTTAGLAGCGASDKPAAQQESAGKTEAAETVSGETGSSEQAGGEKVRIKLFTGKIETIDVMDDIIADFNASQDRIEVEQEYQKDASNIIKIKFASGEVPDIMTTYEQGFVDEGKPYNPLEKEKPDVTVSAKERQIGGLGVFLAQKMMDDISYEFQNGKNILTICKKFK